MNRRDFLKCSCAGTIVASAPLCAFGADDKSVIDRIGVGSVDITPTEPVGLAGSPTPLKSSAVGTHLYVKALVLSSAAQKVAIVTLDILKYPVDCVEQARKKVEQTTGIPARNVIICASHTHRGPHWTYYPDKLVTPIAEAVAQAARDLTPCTFGTAKGKAEGVSECRRVIKDGQAWDRFQLKLPEQHNYPPESQYDPAFDVLALTGPDGKYKAILYNFACHAANTRDLVVSADFPGDVQKFVEAQLGYAAPTFFLTGACGDVNPNYTVDRDLFGKTLGGAIMQCLGKLEPIASPALAIETRQIPMPGREQPELKEADIALKWPGQLEHYKKAFAEMKKREKSSYPYSFTGIRIGRDFAIVTNPDELFCEIGQHIKQQSPFKYTMVVEQTNGAHGYVPTIKAFAGGTYETWFGEHSYLTIKAGEIIEKESLEILGKLKSS